MCVPTTNEKEAMSLKDKKKRFMGGFGRGKGKGEMMSLLLY